MDIQEAYRSFTYRLNKFGTNANQNVDLPQFVSVLNKAQIHWVDFRAKILERDQTRVEELRILLKDYKQGQASVPNPVKVENYYRWKLPSDYFRFVRMYGETSCGPIFIKPVEEGNVNALLSSAFTKPSAEWEETFSTSFGDSVRIYTDGFAISNLNLKYIRVPREVDIAGYIKAGGTPSQNIDLEFNDTNAEEIIDLAAMITSGDIGDIQRWQALSTHRQEHN